MPTGQDGNGEKVHWDITQHNCGTIEAILFRVKGIFVISKLLSVQPVFIFFCG
jgi:hypothetical protein